MQTSVRDSMVIGLNGQIADIAPHDVISRTNNAKQLELVTVATAENDKTYTVTINGVAHDFLADGSATKTEISAGLVAAIIAGDEPVTPVDLVETFTVQADVAGTAFTIAVSDDGAGTNLTVANQISNQQEVTFGKFVVQDPDGAEKCHLPYLAAHITGLRSLGFAAHNQAHEQARNVANNPGYEFQSEITILNKGRIYVAMEDAFTPEDAIYIRFKTGTGSELGAARTDADSTTAALLGSAVIRNSGSAGELAIIDINKP